MVLHVLRGLFILLMAAVGWFYLELTWLSMAIALGTGVLFVSIDILSPRKKLVVFSGVLMGLLVGVVIAFAMHFAINLVVDQMEASLRILVDQAKLVQFITLVVGLISCYLSISFTLQTRDDFRFIIPYIEFRKRSKGHRALLLDTSVLIDGRLNDIVKTGFLDAELVVPRFVLEELQSLADSGDRLKRNRGRLGLDVLARLRNDDQADVLLHESVPHHVDADSSVDQKLIALAKELGARVLTNDFNLNKVAQLRGVDVLNLNELANTLRPVLQPGERMVVKLVKPGESAGQGVGYLDDGTMVVVEQGRSHLQEDVEVTVTSALQTNAGRMIFGRLDGRSDTALPDPRRNPRGESSAAPR